ncbi:unnamed protein product [Boreogadus saida]
MSDLSEVGAEQHPVPDHRHTPCDRKENNRISNHTHARARNTAFPLHIPLQPLSAVRSFSVFVSDRRPEKHGKNTARRADSQWESSEGARRGAERPELAAEDKGNVR